MKKEHFLSVTLNQVSQVYEGKRECCRCGCGGTYTATSFMKNARSEVNDMVVVKAIEKAKKLIKTGAEVFEGDTFIDVMTKKTKNGVNRSLTFYFDETK